MTKPSDFIKKLNTSQTLIGLDFGDKTIGLAISDMTKTIATPVLTLKRESISKDIKSLSKIINEYNVGGAVIGLPLSLDGNENKRTIKVRDFSKYLNKVIKTTFYDERFSTDVIYKELRKNSLSSNKIKKKIDHLAASYILQGFLDNAKNN
ncbi:MAG: putative pre-16S rRNA nuclease [Alphaproteobacteria bacterium MarineAlpha5_Bin8]|nr:MAG: putative pre-16S rRNA nuclease [Alphaproteobacteria bacterium MarineAlpha5_Bin7]PPR46253.1 MAG: putative pre-16S rRNA nuclease [Alphaproteobacteria bacterium MarineAlpha5_Bin8]PPR53402.1 MAG: putative pre-16S rRNA nuclease [Alphaproteobacteria bacterium MarineAlpha5_Bin6]|tara:strand:+ start:149 stop:601 length:453 start_codon:yes stop_codon:yes gene_type:complete